MDDEELYVLAVVCKGAIERMQFLHHCVAVAVPEMHENRCAKVIVQACERAVAAGKGEVRRRGNIERGAFRVGDRGFAGRLLLRLPGLRTPARQLSDQQQASDQH